MVEDRQGSQYPERWDRHWIEKRILKESERLGYAGKENPAHPIPQALPYRLLDWGLKFTPLYDRGYLNYKDIQLNKIAHYILGWQPAMTGFRILQISDLHIDLDPGLIDPLCELIKNVKCDIAVFTGDFWEGNHSDQTTALARIDRLLDSLPAPRYGCFGVLGNHDSVALGASLDARGIRILVNEAVTIETKKGPIALAGVDDAYYFALHDVAKAARECPVGMPKFLLSHSPQLAPEAQKAGFSLMLSGHTHGGQICGPGGFSPVNMQQIPPALFKGAWRRGSLVGYTTTGTGSCHVPVRFNCPPEVVLHSVDHTP